MAVLNFGMEKIAKYFFVEIVLKIESCNMISMCARRGDKNVGLPIPISKILGERIARYDVLDFRHVCEGTMNRRMNAI